MDDREKKLGIQVIPPIQIILPFQIRAYITQFYLTDNAMLKF